MKQILILLFACMLMFCGCGETEASTSSESSFESVASSSSEDIESSIDSETETSTSAESSVIDSIEPEPESSFVSTDVCTVTFVTFGGSFVEPQVIARGDKAIEPPVPTKECRCEFVGWYLGGEKWSFTDYLVPGDITLTAKWIKCFGFDEKELEILKSLSFFDGNPYTWLDVEDIQRGDCIWDGHYNEGCWRYTITFKSGITKTIDIAKDCLED